MAHVRRALAALTGSAHRARVAELQAERDGYLDAAHRRLDSLPPPALSARESGDDYEPAPASAHATAG